MLSETHSYTVGTLDDYSSYHEFEGMNLSGKSEFFLLSVRDGSELQNLSLDYIKGKKRRSVKISKSTITSTVSNGSFFSGATTYYVPVDPSVQFSIHYSLKEENSIFISNFYKDGYYESDQVTYSFNIPQGLVASISNGDKKTGAFQLSASNFKEDEDIIFMLVHPKGEEKETYFSNWFEERIGKINAINPKEIPEHLTQLKANGAEEELAAACFKYVQDEIRYLDIENGINAIIPRSCEYVLSNKFGDCKDMANTLVALLNHFGFEAYNCISKTNSREGEFDFPSLGKANHMIAGLKLKDKWIYLDPTEDNCLFGDPSIQILGTEAFAIGHKEQFFLKVPESPKSKTEVLIDYLLDVENRKIQVNLTFLGKTNTLLVNQKENTEVMEIIANKVFSYALPLKEKSISMSTSVLRFEGELPMAFLSELSTKTILQTDFLADIRSVFIVAGYANYPIYPLQINSSIRFENLTCSNLKVKEEIWTKECENNSLESKQSWSSYKSNEEFEESSEWTNFETFSQKPLIITE